MITRLLIASCLVEGLDTELGGVDRFTMVADVVENAAPEEGRDREDLFTQVNS
jgi:hypothetical protein